jgi:hypothetical protein
MERHALSRESCATEMARHSNQDAPMQIRMIHHGRDRDSLLMPLDARTIDLMIQYRIHLVRCEPTSHFHVGSTHTHATGDGIVHVPEGLGGPFHLDPWTTAEWMAFRANFVPVITRYWDRKFELTPNRPWYRPFGSPRAAAARITCSLSLDLVDVAAQAHLLYYIVKPQEWNFRSFAVPEDRRGLFTHRDLSFQTRNLQTPVGHHVRHQVSFRQCTILHEFGHTLGLPHVNGAGNSNSNYGVTLDQREDLMGVGDHVTAREARPWISQLRRHHLIAGHGNRDDAALRFTARVVAPQIITYWDNDWVPTPAAAPHAAH